MRIVKTILVLLFFSFMLYAQDEEWDEEQTSYRQGGIVFTMAETGSGFGGFFSWPLLQSMHFGLATDLLFIRDSKEITYTDPYYYYPVTYNKINNVYLIDIFFIVKKRLFSKSMDEGFRPFITAAAGPIYGINHPEKWAKKQYGLSNTSDLTLGGFFGAGVDINAGSSYFFSIRAQYRIIPFNEIIGETDNHSMLELRFELGKRF
jgi:hypothetical protein